MASQRDPGDAKPLTAVQEAADEVLAEMDRRLQMARAEVQRAKKLRKATEKETPPS
jgi:ABC-type Fe3+-hydroxamate transport system substrate-binding protein